MRISNEQVQQVQAAQGVKPAKGAKGASGVGPAAANDAVTMSTMGQEIGKALASLANVPDIRADRVAELKAQIEAGTYNVPGRDVAASVLRRAADQLL